MEFILPLILSFAMTVIAMPFFIKYLQHKQFGQTTREEGPAWHTKKSGTPTMGGMVFILAALISSLLVALLMGLADGMFWMIWLALLAFGLIGFSDDFISIFRGQNEGLTARQKFISQLVLAALIVGLALLTKVPFAIPVFGWQLKHPLLILLFGILWLTGFSNAVNLTDGLDGLAAGLNIFAYGAYFVMAMKDNQLTLALLCFSVIGALLGFLYYNRLPANIFMGDVGSLALGAGLAAISMCLNNPWSLLIVGSVFVIETLSVILQVLSFKTRGKRIFKMSPIHHHFEMSGWSETKVVYVFWGCGLAAALLASWLF